MIRYAFKSDEVLTIKAAGKADPQKIGEALAKITDDNKGHLTPHAVVETARNPRHVLHRHFEWDNKKAAESFRLDQARSLVRSIHVEADTETGTARAFLSVRDTDGVSYRGLSDVLKSHDLQQRVLNQAEKDLIAFEARYRSLEDVCALVRAARERLSERRNNQESGVSASA